MTDIADHAKTVYWLDDYTDELVPCDCSLEGWAEWLSKPDPEWRRDEAAKDGAAFKASKGDITYHVATLLDDGGCAFTPPLPGRYDSLAHTYAPGKGWDADSLVETADELADLLRGESGDIFVAAIFHDAASWIVTYRENPSRCEAALAQ